LLKASTAFGDDFSITIEDSLHSESKNKLILIEKSIYHKTLVVVHLEQKDSIRIISARWNPSGTRTKATKKEQKFYEES